MNMVQLFASPLFQKCLDDHAAKDAEILRLNGLLEAAVDTLGRCGSQINQLQIRVERLEAMGRVFAEIEGREEWPCMDVWDWEFDGRHGRERDTNFRWMHPDIPNPVEFARKALES